MKSLYLLALLSLVMVFSLSLVIACGDDDDDDSIGDDDDDSTGDDDDDDDTGNPGDCASLGQELADCLLNCGSDYDCYFNCYDTYMSDLIAACGAGQCGADCWDAYVSCYNGCADANCQAQCTNDFGTCYAGCLS